jgi:hypothetical protein
LRQLQNREKVPQPQNPNKSMRGGRLADARG